MTEATLALIAVSVRGLSYVRGVDTSKQALRQTEIKNGFSGFANYAVSIRLLSDDR